MINKNIRLRILFNDSHSNLPSNDTIPQGGPASFSGKLSAYFNKKEKNVELISILFSHNPNTQDIFIKETIGKHKYYELYYPREKLLKTYSKEFTKKDYLKFLEPWLMEVDKIFEMSKPDIVFLNGFSISNWLIMEAAYRRKIPISIQHAGIWKKELTVSQKHFSKSIKKIFASLEKEIYVKASHQIFLNEFSRDVFFDIHNIPQNKNTFSKTSIIPLPIEIKGFKPATLTDKKVYKLGVVARWDGIKNHDAVLRLAKYVEKFNLPQSIEVVTGLTEKLTDYKTEYQKHVSIVKPMSPDELKTFYKNQDIILIPSRFDVSPTVLMEALLLGKPVIISSSVGWVSDFHRFNLNKLIINPNDSGKTIYDIINKLIIDKDIYIKRFTKFQNKIINKHSIEKVFDNYYKVFLKISK